VNQQQQHHHHHNDEHAKDEKGDDVLKNIILTDDDNDDDDASKESSSSSNNNISNNISNKGKKNRRDYCYVNDPNVRLRFLRCERFDARKAVKRLVKFLDFAKALFGNFVADRPIRNADFSRDELKHLHNSRLTYLPFRDQAGRRVLTGVGNNNTRLTLQLRYKIIMYLDWIVSEDIETQQKGIVIVAWPSNDIGNSKCSNCSETSISNSSNSNSNKMLFQNISFNSTPLRITSIHFCAPNETIYKDIRSLYYFGLDQYCKSRFKTHYGK
jgi:hypothetical protein